MHYNDDYLKKACFDYNAKAAKDAEIGAEMKKTEETMA